DEVPAPTRVDHDARARGDEVTRKNGTARLMPERDVIRRVPRCPQRGDRFAAGPYLLTVVDPSPRDGVLAVFRRPWILRELRAGIDAGQKRRARRMIRVPVCDEHATDARAPRSQLAIDVGEVKRMADTGV